jgi:hypothetical protein
MRSSHAAAGKRRGSRKANAKGDAKNGKLFHVETPRWRRPAGGSEGISIAPALDTAADVIILALRLSCESLPGRKFMRIPAVPTTATITVTITGIKSPRRFFVSAWSFMFRAICCSMCVMLI